MHTNPASDELVQVEVVICGLCLGGYGGECHTPGCVFWCCPGPDEEQAEALRRCLP